MRESVDPTDFLFCPSFESIPKCSLAFEHISFLSATLLDLYHNLTIFNTKDYINISSQEASCSAGKVLQIMGCSRKATTIVINIIVQVNGVVVGSSFLSDFTKNDRITSTTPISAVFHHHHEYVVEQVRSAWDDVSSCYLISWISLSPSTINRLPCLFEGDPNKYIFTEQ